MLDKNLDEANNQYQIAIRNHLIHIDTLFEVTFLLFRFKTQEFMALWKNSRGMFQSERLNIPLKGNKCSRLTVII